MEILTSVKRLYIRFKSLVNDFVYSFGRAVPVRERRRIRVNRLLAHGSAWTLVAGTQDVALQFTHLPHTCGRHASKVACTRVSVRLVGRTAAH